MRFGADAALDGVDFRLFPGEVHSLMGENGAGKSTLIKAITGALPLSAGRAPARRTSVVRFGVAARGAAAPGSARSTRRSTCCRTSPSPRTSRSAASRGGSGVIDWSRMRRDAQAVLRRPRSRHRPGLPARSALARDPAAGRDRAGHLDRRRVLVLDEPTSSLDSDECAELFRVIRDLKQRGVAILFVSHFLDQVYEISDRVTVLRDGKLVGEYLTKELLRIDLVQAMLGRSAASLRARPRLHVAEESPAALPQRARACTVGSGIEDADVDLMEGEVLGVAGLLGSGRTELARAITGLDKLDAGIIRVEGQRAAPGRAPRPRSSLGVVYSSENRRTEGIISELSVRENITLALQAERGFLRRLRPARQRELAAAGSTRSTSAPPTSTVPRARSRAATSRRCCWPACSPSRRAPWCWTSRPAASTSAPRSRSRTWSASSPTTACR